jgi:hypothetical protein
MLVWSDASNAVTPPGSLCLQPAVLPLPLLLLLLPQGWLPPWQPAWPACLQARLHCCPGVLGAPASLMARQLAPVMDCLRGAVAWGGALAVLGWAHC